MWSRESLFCLLNKKQFQGKKVTRQVISVNNQFRNLPKPFMAKVVEEHPEISVHEEDNVSLDGSITEAIASVDDSNKIPLGGSVRDRLRRRRVSQLISLQKHQLLKIARMHQDRLQEHLTQILVCIQWKMTGTWTWTSNGLAKELYINYEQNNLYSLLILFTNCIQYFFKIQFNLSNYMHLYLLVMPRLTRKSPSIDQDELTIDETKLKSAKATASGSGLKNNKLKNVSVKRSSIEISYLYRLKKKTW